jgi:RNA polymerase subunit RPABC4/transcription elongation factor Spt4
MSTTAPVTTDLCTVCSTTDFPEPATTTAAHCGTTDRVCTECATVLRTRFTCPLCGD